MKISKQARRDAKQLFRSCVNNGLLDEGRVRQAVTSVLTQKPRGYMGILSHLQRLVKLDFDPPHGAGGKRRGSTVAGAAGGGFKPIFRPPGTGRG